jgi:hypothetical protein
MLLIVMNHKMREINNKKINNGIISKGLRDSKMIQRSSMIIINDCNEFFEACIN